MKSSENLARGSEGRAPLKVLHVAQPIWTGVPVAVSGYVRMLKAHSWDNVVAAPGGGELTAAVEAAGATVVPWPAEREPGISVADEAWRLDALVRRLRPDVVHLHSSKAGLAGRLIPRRGAVRVFSPHAWSWHAVSGPTAVATRAWEKLAARRTDAIMCGSPGEVAAGRDAGLRPNRWAMVANTIDPNDLPTMDQDGSRDELSLGTGRVVVCVARLARQKGQDILLEAWRLAGLKDARLVLVGAGEVTSVVSKPLPDGVSVVTPSSRREALVWTLAADMVVSASRYETLSLSVLEAAALGKPVVATDVAGTREALAGSPGLIVPPEDPAGLAHAMVVALQRGPAGRHAAEESGRDIRRRLRQDFDNAGRDLDHLYRGLLCAAPSSDRSLSSADAGRGRSQAVNEWTQRVIRRRAGDEGGPAPRR